jgi:hypothetical protein
VTAEDRQVEEAIRRRAMHDSGFAIAYAVLRLAAAQDRTATWVKNLGTADAATPMGAIEALAVVMRDGMRDIAQAIGE